MNTGSEGNMKMITRDALTTLLRNTQETCFARLNVKSKTKIGKTSSLGEVWKTSNVRVLLNYFKNEKLLAELCRRDMNDCPKWATPNNDNSLCEHLGTGKLYLRAIPWRNGTSNVCYIDTDGMIVQADKVHKTLYPKGIPAERTNHLTSLVYSLDNIQGIELNGESYTVEG